MQMQEWKIELLSLRWKRLTCSRWCCFCCRL